MTAPASELRAVLGRYRRLFAWVGAFSLVINLLFLVPSIYMLQVYDRVLTSRSLDTLLLLTAIVVFLYGIVGALEFVRTRVLARVGASLETRLNGRVFDAMFEASLRRGSAQVQPLADLQNVRQFLHGSGTLAFMDSPWIPIYIVVIFLLSPWLGALALAGAAVLVALAVLTEQVTKQPLAAAGSEAGRATRYAGSKLQNAEVVEALGMLDNLRQGWLVRQERMLAMQMVAADRAGGIQAASKFFRITVQSLILGAGAWLVLRGETTPGTMIAASILTGRALAPVEQAIAVWRQMNQARSSFFRLEDLLRAFPARAEVMRLPAPQGRVTAENLVVSAPGRERPILRGLSFEVAPGQVVAVIGPSGSGKSTLARALTGVWVPAAGLVRLDGADVARWGRAELGPHLGYLPQDVELFDGTVAENIARFGEVEPEAVVAAAKLADVHEMILALPAGYETRIGPGGSVLSGGQRQRVALARAVYGRPTLIVLDEPNASLDEAGESALVGTINALRADRRTVFLVTHRSALVAIADRVLVMKDGQLAMFGPQDEVRARLSESAGRVRGPRRAAGDGRLAEAATKPKLNSA